MKFALVAACLALTIGCGAEAPEVAAPPPPAPIAPLPPNPKPPELRLPALAKPTREAVALTLVPADDVIHGIADIDLEVLTETDVLWLDGTELTVGDAYLEANGTRWPARAVPGGEDFVGFVFEKPLPRGPAHLHVAYDGKVSPSDDHGVFRVVEQGTAYLYTQFENTDARRAFPCFDEPSYKHPWQVTLRIQSKDRAFSNTQTTAEEVGADGWKTLRFAETPPLPSYLVAFVVGPLEAVTAPPTKRGVPIRIITPKGKQAEAAYAAKTTAGLIDLLEDYFGIPYAYGKMDVVPVPKLASFGAMENAGLITIGMKYSLANREEDTLAFERAYTDTMAHELAHQWFGDLVTMAWWDDVWLNEAFATWMGNKTVQRAHPEWRYDLSRLHDATGAMNDDALTSARKIRQEILSNDDIQNAFDAITYEKGATVIGMFEQYVGAEAFRKGIRNYLSKHAMKNATSADFLADLSEGAGKDLRAAFSTFLDQPGLPVVSTKLSCGPRGAKLELSQERYLPIGSKDAAAETWQLPICARFARGKDRGEACGLLGSKTGELELPGKGCPTWVMPKSSALAYDRVTYDGKALDALLGKNARDLTVAERVSVIEDASAAVLQGRLQVGEALSRVPELAKDPDPQILSAALDLAGTLHVPDALLPNAQRFIVKSFGARAALMGFRPKKGDTEEERLVRPHLLAAVALGGEDAALLAEAQRLADKWLDDPSSLEAEAIDTVLTAAVMRGDKKLFDRMRAEAKKTQDDTRRGHLLRAMPFFRDPGVLREVYGLVLAEEFDIRDSLHILLVSDRHTEDAQFAFVKEHFDAIVSRLPSEMRPEVFRSANGFCKEEQRAAATAFFGARAEKLTGGPRRLAQVLETVSLCIAQEKAMEPSLTKFLKAY